MNKVELTGRLVRDPEIRYSAGEQSVPMAKFTLAVKRRYQQGNEDTDFIPCMAFSGTATFVEKYFRSGQRVGVTGRIQTGNYTNRDGVKVYTTTVIIEDAEYLEYKEQEHSQRKTGEDKSSLFPPAVGDAFCNIPDGIDDGCPFN